jgi:hypothetical protein
MTMRHLPLNTWLVVEERSPGRRLTLVSKHTTQREAEAELDNRNQGQPKLRFGLHRLGAHCATHGRTASTDYLRECSLDLNLKRGRTLPCNKSRAT